MTKKNTFKKIISCVLLVIFTVTQLERGAWAYAAAGPSFSEVPSAASVFQIDLPPELGTVQEVHSNSGPVIVQVQTAHGSFEAQKNIQAILRHLKNTYGFDLLLLEGSSSQLYPELLEFFPGRNDLNQKAAEELTRQSLVKGDELFLLEDRTAKAYGIENVPVYLGARKSFKEVLLAREASRNFLADLNLQIERMTAAYLNSGLRSFLKTQENFEKEIIPFPAWARELKQSARKNLQIDLQTPAAQFEWPMLARVLKIQEFESSINPEALSKEKEIFKKNIAGLPESSRSEAEKLLRRPLSYSAGPGTDAAHTVENIISALPENFPYQDYPNLKMFFGCLILQSEISPAPLTDELERISGQIILKLSRSEQERKWSALLKKYRTLERLLELELTPPAYEALIKDEDSFRPSVLAGAFKSINQDGRIKNFDFGHLGEIDALFEKSMKFYRSTKDRDFVMLQNIQAKMAENGSRKAVVITGGFHAPAFKDFFVSNGFNYALISPKITSVQGREEYLKSVLQNESPLLKKAAMDLPRRMEMPAVQAAMGEDMAFIDGAMDRALLKTMRSEMRAEKSPEEPAAAEELAQSSSLTFDFLPAYWRYKRLQRVSRLWRSSSEDKYGLLKYLFAERYKDVPGMRDFVIRLMGYFTRGAVKSFDEAAGELIAAYKIEEMLADDYDVEILTLSRVIGAREFDVMFYIRPKPGKTAGKKGSLFFEEGVYFMEAKEDPSANLQTLIRETVNGQVSYQIAVLYLLKQIGVPVKGIIVAAGGQSSSNDKTRKAGQFQTEVFSASAKKNTRGAESEIAVFSVVTDSFDVRKTPAPLGSLVKEPSLPQISRWFDQELKLSNLFLELLGPRFGLKFSADGLEGSPEQTAAYGRLVKQESTAADAIVLQIQDKQHRAREFEAEYQIRETEADKWIQSISTAEIASEKEAGEMFDWYFLKHFKQPLAELVLNLETVKKNGDPAESLQTVWAWVKRQFAERNSLKDAARKAKPPKGRISLDKRLEANLFGPYGWIVVFADQPSIQPAVSESEAEQVLRDYFKPAVDADDDAAYRLLNKTLREEIVWKYGKDRQKSWDALRKIIAERSGPASRQELRAQTNVLYPESTREEIREWFKDRIGFGGVEIKGRYLRPLDFDRNSFSETFNPWKLEYGVRSPWVKEELAPVLDELTGEYDKEKEKNVLNVLVRNNLEKGKLPAAWSEMPVVSEILFPLETSPLIAEGGSNSVITFNLIPGETAGSVLPVLIKTGANLEEEAIFDAIFDRTGIKEFVGVVNLPNGTKGIVYRIIPALREVQGADLSLFITFDLLLMKGVAARLGTRLGTVPFDLANLVPYADMGNIRSFIQRYNQVYESETQTARSEVRNSAAAQTDGPLSGPVLAEDLNELKKIKLVLKNVKPSGPPVTLEFRGEKANGGDDLQIIVNIAGQRIGDFHLLNRPDLLQISWVYPFMGAEDQAALENQGIMSTIINWISWEASVKNVNFENAGTMNLKLIYLYSKYFSIFPNDYGVYDFRNVGSVSLKNKTGRITARSVSFESVSSRPQRYRIISRRNLSSELNGPAIFEIGAGGQLLKVEDTGVPTPLNHYMDDANRSLIVGGKPRNFTLPAGNIFRSELRSSEFPVISEPVLTKSLNELEKIQLDLKNITGSGRDVTLKFVSAGSLGLVVEVYLRGEKHGDFRLAVTPDSYKISWVFPFRKVRGTSLENQGVMSTVLNWLAWETKLKGVKFQNSGTKNLKLIYLYSKFFSTIEGGYEAFDFRNVGGVYSKDAAGKARGISIGLESVTGSPGRYRISSQLPPRSDLKTGQIVEVDPDGSFSIVKDSGEKEPAGYLTEADESVYVSADPKNFMAPAGRISRSEVRSSLKQWGSALLKFAAVTFVLVLINQIIIQSLLANQSQLMVGVDRPELADTARDYYQPASQNYPEGVRILVKDNPDDKNAVFDFIFHYVEDSKKYLKAVSTMPFIWTGVYLGIRAADSLFRALRNRIINYFYKPQTGERYFIFKQIDRIVTFIFWGGTFSYTAGLVLNGADVFFYHAVADYISVENGAHILSPGDLFIWAGAALALFSALVFASRTAVEMFSLENEEEAPETSRSELRVVDGEIFDLKTYQPAPRSPKHVIVHMDQEYQTAFKTVRPAVEKNISLAGAENTFEIVEKNSVLDSLGQLRWVSDPQPVLGGQDSAVPRSDAAGKKAFGLFIENAEDIILTGGFCNSCHEEFFSKIIQMRTARGKRTVLHLPKDAVFYLFENQLKPETFKDTDYFKSLQRLKSAVFFDGKLFWSNSAQPQVIVNIWETMPEWKGRSEVRAARPEISRTEAAAGTVFKKLSSDELRTLLEMPLVLSVLNGGKPSARDVSNSQEKKKLLLKLKEISERGGQGDLFVHITEHKNNFWYSVHSLERVSQAFLQPGVREIFERNGLSALYSEIIKDRKLSGDQWLEILQKIADESSDGILTDESIKVYDLVYGIALGYYPPDVEFYVAQMHGGGQAQTSFVKSHFPELGWRGNPRNLELSKARIKVYEENLDGAVSEIFREINSRSEVRSETPAQSKQLDKIRTLYPQIQEKIKTYGLHHLVRTGKYEWAVEKDFWGAETGYELVIEGLPGDEAEWGECTVGACVAAKILNTNGVPASVVRVFAPNNFAMRFIDLGDLSEVKSWEALAGRLKDAPRAPEVINNEGLLRHGMVKTESNIIVDASAYYRTYSPERLPVWQLEDHPLAGVVRKAQSVKRYAENDFEVKSMGFPLSDNPADSSRPYTIAYQPLKQRALESMDGKQLTVATQLGIGTISDTDSYVFSLASLLRIFDPLTGTFSTPQSFFVFWSVSKKDFYGEEQKKMSEFLSSADAEKMLAFFTDPKNNAQIYVNDNAHGEPGSLSAEWGRLPEVLNAAREDLPYLLEFISKIPLQPVEPQTAFVFQVRPPISKEDVAGVYVSGDFNGWAVPGVPMENIDGLWRVSVPIKDRDQREYKYQVRLTDGRIQWASYPDDIFNPLVNRGTSDNYRFRTYEESTADYLFKKPKPGRARELAKDFTRILLDFEAQGFTLYELAEGSAKNLRLEIFEREFNGQYVLVNREGITRINRAKFAGYSAAFLKEAVMEMIHREAKEYHYSAEEIEAGVQETLASRGRPELRSLSQQALSERDRKIILDGYFKRADGGRVLLGGDGDTAAIFGAPYRRFIPPVPVNENLYRDKKVLVVPGYGNLPFLIKKLGARSVTGIDVDETTLAWQRARALYGNDPEIRRQLDNFDYVEGSAAEVEAVQVRVRENRPPDPVEGISFVSGNLFNALPVDDKEYDLVVVPYIYMMPNGIKDPADFEKTTRELLRVTKENGSVLVTPVEIDFWWQSVVVNSYLVWLQGQREFSQEVSSQSFSLENADFWRKNQVAMKGRYALLRPIVSGPEPAARSEFRLTRELKTRLEFTDYLFPLEWAGQFGKDALMKALNTLGLLTDPNDRTYSETEIKAARKFLGIESAGEVPDAFILGADLALNNGGLVLIDTFLKDSPVVIAADSKESRERLAAYNKERKAQGKKPVPVVAEIKEAEKMFAGNFKNGVNLYGFASPDEISEEWARLLKDKLQIFNSRRMEVFAETFGVSALLESFKTRFAFAKSA